MEDNNLQGRTEGRRTGLRLGPNWRKSISLLPSDVITESQRWQEGVALRINHVASASTTALVTVTSKKEAAVIKQELWWLHPNVTHTVLQTPRVSLGKHYLILGDRLMTGQNMTTSLISKTVNDKTQFAKSIYNTWNSKTDTEGTTTMSYLTAILLIIGVCSLLSYNCKLLQCSATVCLQPHNLWS